MVDVIEVREAYTADADAITRIHLHGWRWAYDTLMPADYLASLNQLTPERLEQRRQRLAERHDDRRTLVATDAEDVIGFTSIGRYRNNQDTTDLVDDVGEIYAIYVAPDETGQGVGRVLLDAAVVWLRAQGLDPIRLWVLEGNVRARAFYERYGFSLDGGRSTFTLDQPGDLPLELPELRYSLAAA